MRNSSPNKQATYHYLALFIGIICISWSAPLVKLANVEGIASAFYRMFFATVICLPLYVFRKGTVWPPKDIILKGIVGGVFFGCDIALWNSALIISKASVTTLLANLAPIWVGLGAILLYKEKLKLNYWLGSVFAFSGVLLILGIFNLNMIGFETGYVLSIVASFFYAAYLLSTQKTRAVSDNLSFTLVSFASSAVVLFIMSLFFETKLTGFSNESWLYLILLAIIPQLTGWLSINYALGYIRSSIASVSLLSQSVFTALIAYPVLGEDLTIIEIVGGVIVLFGIYLVNIKPRGQDI